MYSFGNFMMGIGILRNRLEGLQHSWEKREIYTKL